MMRWENEPYTDKKNNPSLWVILTLMLILTVVFSLMQPSSAGQEPEYIVHIVQPGDTLWTVARERQEECGFKGDIRELVWEIQVASDTTALIRPGQILLVPVR